MSPIDKDFHRKDWDESETLLLDAQQSSLWIQPSLEASRR